MKIKTRDIDPGLRLIGQLIRILWGSFSERKFRVCQRIMNLLPKARGTKRLSCRTEYAFRPDGTKLRLCVYSPKLPSKNMTGLLWLHGGGFAIGSPEQDAGFIKELSDVSPTVTVSPDYRLSTEAPFPAVTDDCYLALLWLRDNAQRLGVRSDQIFVGGDSAGGGLSAAVTLMARDKGEVAVAFQMPLYPMLDDRPTGSSADNDAPIWDSRSNNAAWDLYLGEARGGNGVSKYAAPARENDLSHLPLALTYIGDIEPFYCETIAYFDALKAAGVHAECRVYKGCFHAFDILPKSIKKVRSAREFLTRGYKYAVNNYFSEQPKG